jgi:flagellar biosynthesis protein
MPDPDLAVALRFDPADGLLPHVTAKGRGAVARQIVELARRHGIALRHDPDLAQILGKLDVGSPIPAAAFAAVAEILAYLYHLNRSLPGDGSSQGRAA